MKKSILVLFMLFPLMCFAQSDFKNTAQFNFGCNLNLHYGTGQRYPGIKVFCGFGVSSIYKNHLLLNYGASVSIYSKSLGNNLNSLLNDVQLDFINAFSFGAGLNDLSYTKNFRTLNNSPYYTVSIPKDYALLFTSNFVLNNHRRNQAVGAVSFSFPGVTVNYANDGAAPFEWIPLADLFDRWWTGSVVVFAHTRSNYNCAEISFDQFTGYTPLLYELSTLLGVDMPAYNAKNPYVTEDEIKNPPSFNTSAYNIKIFPVKGYGIDVGMIGSLRNNNGRAFALQDIIHILGGFALHPNNDNNRFYIGGTYNNLSDVDIEN